MFRTENAAVLLAHINIRNEKHGDEEVGAIDVKITCQVPNTFLDQFNKRLRPTFFQRDGGGDQPDMLDEAHMPSIRFPKIDHIDWDDDFDGYTAKFGTELGLAPAVTLTRAKVDKFRFKFGDNGVVDVTYRVRGNPTPEQVAALFALNGSGILLTLEPPVSDGSGAAKVKDEAVRKANREAGQDDILDRQEREAGDGDDVGGADAALATANAMEDALRAAGHIPDDGIELLMPPADPANDTPDTDLVVALLKQRGFAVSPGKLEDPNGPFSDYDYGQLLGYLRGTHQAPEVLHQFAVAPKEPEKAETPKPAGKKKRSGKTVD